MCARMYFNINILHMYQVVYSKHWKNESLGCFGFIYLFIHFLIEQIELSE